MGAAPTGEPKLGGAMPIMVPLSWLRGWAPAAPPAPLALAAGWGDAGGAAEPMAGGATPTMVPFRAARWAPWGEPGCAPPGDAGVGPPAPAAPTPPGPAPDCPAPACPANGDFPSNIVPLNLGAAGLACWSSKPHCLQRAAASSLLVPQLGQNTDLYLRGRLRRSERSPPEPTRGARGGTSVESRKKPDAGR